MFNPEAPAIEEFCDEFRDWVSMPGHNETFHNLQDVASALKRSPARSYINERFVASKYLSNNGNLNSFSDSPFVRPRYTPSEPGSESSLGSDYSDSEYLTPLQSKVSSFETGFSDDSGTMPYDYVTDLTSVFERLSLYTDVLFDSVELIGSIVTWRTEQNIEKFEKYSRDMVRPLRCIRLNCEWVFDGTAEWREHSESCDDFGLKLVVPTATKKTAHITYKCPFTKCGEGRLGFTDFKGLQQHQNDVHGVYLCVRESCGVAFLNLDVAKTHAINVHGNTKDGSTYIRWSPLNVSKWRNQATTFVPNKEVLFDLTLEPKNMIEHDPEGKNSSPNNRPSRQQTIPTIGALAPGSLRMTRSATNLPAVATSKRRMGHARSRSVSSALKTKEPIVEFVGHQRSESFEGLDSIRKMISPFLMGGGKPFFPQTHMDPSI